MNRRLAAPGVSGKCTPESPARPDTPLYINRTLRSGVEAQSLRQVSGRYPMSYTDECHTLSILIEGNPTGYSGQQTPDTPV